MRLVGTGFLAAVFLLVPSAVHADAKKSALDKRTLESYVRHLLLWGPLIHVTISDPEPSEIGGFHQVRVVGTAGQASQEQVFYISKDGKKILLASVYDVEKNPFHKAIDALDTRWQPSLGTPGAPVKLVLFSDFECAHCRQEAEVLRRNLVKSYPKQVRLYFMDFPLDPIHPWARPAAIAGRCVFAQSEEAFWAYHDWIFEHQSEVTPENLKAKVIQFASTHKNLDALRLGRCMDTKATEEEVNRTIAQGRELQVNGTPTFFINGRRIPAGLPWENLKQIIDLEIDYQTTAMNAGDGDCCAVKLPVPTTQ